MISFFLLDAGAEGIFSVSEKNGQLTFAVPRTPCQPGWSFVIQVCLHFYFRNKEIDICRGTLCDPLKYNNLIFQELIFIFGIQNLPSSRYCFIHLDGYQKQEIVLTLLKHLGDSTTVRIAALSLLCSLAHDHTAEMSKFTIFLKVCILLCLCFVILMK